jgi:hypothetical protein
MNIRKTLLSISAVLFLAAGLGAGCAKSPEDVCQHLNKLASKEVGAKMAKGANAGCVKRWKRAKEMKGYFKYRRVSRCVTSADSLKKAVKCE